MAGKHDDPQLSPKQQRILERLAEESVHQTVHGNTDEAVALTRRANVVALTDTIARRGRR